MRLLDFDNILNARDFGGYDSAHGTLVTDKLFRTAHMAKASDSDLKTLKSLGIGLIVDLRYLAEREREPNRWPEGSPVRTLAFDATLTGRAPHESFMQFELNSPEDAVRYMTKSYAERPHQSAFKTIFSGCLSHMAQTGDRMIVHCAAGKDRTGTLVALIQTLLGVSAQDVMDDYMLTMSAVDVEGIMEFAAPLISERYERVITPDLLRPMFSVSPDYLRASLEAMGNVQDYAYNVLGLTDTQYAAIKAAYIA